MFPNVNVVDFASNFDSADNVIIYIIDDTYFPSGQEECPICSLTCSLLLNILLKSSGIFLEWITTNLM